MNKFTFQTIRAGFVLVVALLMATNTAFASAVILSTEAIEVTDTSAVLTSQFDNAGKNSYVHFEWFNGSGQPTVVGTQSFSVGSSFKTKLEGLNPNTTYSFRSVVVARPVTGGAAEAPVYSPMVYFTTLAKGGSSASVNTITQTTGNGNNGATKNTTISKTASPVVVAKKTSTQTVADTKDGFTNTSNSASVIGSGASIFPTTLTGWIIFFIALLIIILIVRMIYEESEKRKKARLAQKEALAAAEAAKKAAAATV